MKNKTYDIVWNGVLVASMPQPKPDNFHIFGVVRWCDVDAKGRLEAELEEEREPVVVFDGMRMYLTSVLDDMIELRRIVGAGE